MLVDQFSHWDQKEPSSRHQRFFRFRLLIWNILKWDCSNGLNKGRGITFLRANFLCLDSDRNWNLVSNSRPSTKDERSCSQRAGSSAKNNLVSKFKRNVHFESFQSQSTSDKLVDKIIWAAKVFEVLTIGKQIKKSNKIIWDFYFCRF